MGLIIEDEATYRAKAKQNLSSHALADFRKCPAFYKKKHIDGLIPDEDRPAYVLGRAAHKLILEGRESYDKRYIVGGPINEKTGRPYGSETKAFGEWARGHYPREVLPEDQALVVESMLAAVALSREAGALLSEGQAEGVARAEYLGRPCQSRIDFLSPSRGLVDLKTCDDLTWFESDAKRYGYAYQLAFYRSMLRLIGFGGPVHLIAVEKKEPFRCGVWLVAEDLLDQAQAENEAAIRRLIECDKASRWPTGYEEVRTLGL